MHLRHCFFVSVFVLVLFFGGASFASAATIYTNSATGDDSTGDGSSGNPYKTFHKAYTSASSGDTINLTGTFTWSDADETGDSATTGYTIGKSLTLQGQSATSTIIQAASSAYTADRGVFVVSGSGISVTMNDLTIRYGYNTVDSGAAGIHISSSANLTLNEVIVTQNASNGRFGVSGMRMDSSGSLIIRNSTIHDNDGIAAQAQNSASWPGYTGGLQIGGSGSIELTNVTFTENTATYNGAVYQSHSSSVVRMTNTTSVNNKGNTTGHNYSLWSGTLYIKNSILADRPLSGAPDFLIQSGTVYDGGHNIVETQSGSTFTNGVNGNLVGNQASLNIDSSLSDNNGTVPTLNIASDSVAVDAGGGGVNGSINVPAQDARGLYRTALPDIGAYEYNATQSAPSVSAPTTAATSVSVGTISQASTTISWTNGNGAARVVFMKADATSGSSAPVDGTTYTATSTFASGSQIGSTGWYAVYDGTGSSVTVSNLDSSKNYRVHVVEYNGVYVGTQKYLTDAGSGNPATKSAYAGTTIYANNSTGNDSTGNGSSGNPYKTFNKAYTSTVDGDTIDLTGTFTWTDTDETGDSATTGYTIGKSLTLRGQGATSTIIQSATASTTGDRRVFTVSSTASTTMTDLMIRHGRLTTSVSGGGIQNNGTTTLERIHLRENSTTNTSSGYGGGFANLGYAVIRDSAVLYNYGAVQGGGIASPFTGTQSTKPTVMTIVNTTIAFNTQANTSGTVGGAGIFAREGTVNVLNSTIVENNHTGSGNSNGVGVSTGGGTVNIKNSIVAHNRRQGVYVRDTSGSYYDASGITDQGNIIVGKVSSVSGYNNSSWYDSTGSGTGDGVYRTVGSATPTGGLNINDTLNTDIGAFPLLADSIAIDSGATTALGSIAVPSADQSLSARDGSPDIGAMEYRADLASDTTAPTVSLTAPTDGATVSGAAVTLSATASDNIGVVDVKFYIDNTLVATDTSSPYSVSWDSTTVSSGSKSLVAVARDAANNYATSSVRTITVSNDSTTPTVSLTLPNDGATIYGSAISISADASDDEGVAGVKFYINNVLIGSEDTSAPYAITWDSLSATTSGQKIIFAVARDTSNNYATSSSRTVTLANQPTPTSIATSTTTSTATITWTTPVEGSTRLFFGLTSALASSTQEANTGTRVTDHSVNLSGLPPCTVFRYQTVSKNAMNEIATSTEATFTTGGCTGGASVLANGEDDITVASGGTLTQGVLSLTVPASFTGSASQATFQAKRLDGSVFFAAAGAPSGKTRAGTTVYNLSAYTGITTTISTFDQPLTIRLSYSDSDISGLDETSLKIYRYDGSSWNELSSCSVDANANTVSCTTTQFSDFGIFGDENEDEGIENSASSSSISGGGIHYGCKDTNAVNYEYFAQHDQSLCRYEEQTITRMTFTRDLDIGTSGDDVVTLQRFLIEKGYTILAGATGYFGLQTKNALSAFQSAHGIVPAQGYFGPKTRSFIERGDAPVEIIHTDQPEVLPPHVSTSTPPAFTRDLTGGNQGDDVAALQSFLIQRGFSIPSGVTGYFGNETKVALTAFQSAHDIEPAQGYLGPITRAFLEAFRDSNRAGD